MSRQMLNIDLRLERTTGGDFESQMREQGLSFNGARVLMDDEQIKMDVRADQLQVEKTIGRGACSYVQRARHKKNGKLYAIKVFNLYESDRRSQLLHELKMFSCSDCPALIKFEGAYHREGTVNMVLEFMDRGTLQSLIDIDDDVPELVIAGCMYQVLWGLGYLHYENLIHRDMKPPNILVKSDGSVKISDFGIAKILEEGTDLTSTMIGTFRYMSPERLAGTDYDTGSDVWSVGIIVFEMWAKKHPFGSADSVIELSQTLFDTDVSDVLHREGLEGLMFDFTRLSLEKDFRRRTKADVLVEHEWFQVMGVSGFEEAQTAVRGYISDKLSDPTVMGDATATYAEEKLVCTIESEPSDDDADDDLAESMSLGTEGKSKDISNPKRK